MIARHSNARASRYRALFDALPRVLGRVQGAREQSGQAIVELALTITLVFLLLGAAADLALMYKAYQNLVNATAEASTYLDWQPKRPCDGCDSIAAANDEARRRFRNEQGGVISHFASTLDLNANGQDDYTESNGKAMVAAMVKIDAADNTQIDAAASGAFALKQSFNPNGTASVCIQRAALPVSLANPYVTSCYIVIRSEIVYRPFLLRAVLGDVRVIRAISVRRVVVGS